ncbi:lysylphosphatidylglycerol synthase transmembrane domain-containing protein [Cytophagales bacterium LB-30]|uniref:Lysylphosphatidylglycerol synthase transmembrane domain-containing protein n=1 Tax=Shiella aurantiaca TaxID=3058365 RepID=A0ABT8F1X7_9BACT|nr:lysylphosphatidylglycerol synthase transmembrane domain-containing protein [Shiella aurantiaca]MDN4164393.1 lysylphosphatidylglycerol synthase transmembrane domain-containing protein [Shiella aurantiaca]
MQYKASVEIIRAHRRTISRAIKTVLFIAIAFFFYVKWQQQAIDFPRLLSSFNFEDKLWLLIAVLVLMPLNWAMEALKWQHACTLVEKITFWEAFAGVLHGLSFGLVTPHALGDYLGRVWSLKSKDRSHAVGMVLFTRSAQMVPTLVLGLFSILYLPQVPVQVSVLLASIAVIVMLLARWRKPISALLKRTSWFDSLTMLSFRNVGDILMLSFIRYGIFLLQFYLIMKAAKVEASDVVILMGIAWIFLAKSLLPSFNFLSDLGIREFSAVIYFDALGVPLEPVLAASLLLWCVNIMLPGLIGLWFIGRLKPFSPSDE